MDGKDTQTTTTAGMMLERSAGATPDAARLKTALRRRKRIVKPGA